MRYNLFAEQHKLHMTDKTKSNYQRTADWLAACGKTPNEKDLATQVGCHLEELCEFLDEIGIIGSMADGDSIMLASTRIKGVAHRLKQGHIGVRFRDRVNALDALCDAEVTGNGVAFLAGFRKEEADFRVLRSNDSKLVDGKALLAPGGKIMKGPNYHPPFLQDLV